MNILVDGQTFMSPEINRGIGTYLKNTLNNMVKQSYEDIWYVAVSDENSLNCLDPWVRERVVPITDDLFAPSTDYGNRTEAYTKHLNEIVKIYNIDCYWNPNPLMLNVLFPNDTLQCECYLTLYDLIPIVKPINNWDVVLKNEYYRRIKFLSIHKATLLCISYATEKDVHKYIVGNPTTKVIHLAADTKLFYKCAERDGINDNPIILYTGGFDYRKNLKGAVDAFVFLKTKFKEDYYVQKIKLLIVCKYQEHDKQYLVERLKKNSLQDSVIFTGFVSDVELAKLYQDADLFFFPSLYEGFGLPLLEAMLGGSLVLSANNSSLPEVCGGNGILFETSSVETMASALKEGIERVSQEDKYAKQQRQNYALQFTWEKTASLTLKEFYKNDIPIKNKMKIAIVTPWPDQETGIANFEYMLIPYMSKYFDVDVYVDDKLDCKNIKSFEYGKVYYLSELGERRHKYKHIIFQIGNNSEFHKGIYLALKEYGGISEIHDYVINPFFYHAFYLNGNKDEYLWALEQGYGDNGVNHFNNISAGITSPDINEFSMAHSIANISKATIVHNNWTKEQLKECKNVITIPLASFDKKNTMVNDFSKRIAKKLENIKEDSVVIGCFGFINLNKRPRILVNAFKRLLKEGLNVKLVFWGKSNVNELLNECGDDIIITGYLNESDYENAFEMTDIVVNLRYPSMGESSGTLCEAFKYSKPVIVTDVNQYKEFPDDVCWKVPANEQEEVLLYETLKYLINHEDVRIALGENAKNYADVILSPNRIAYQYYKFLNGIGGAL